jgi:hypothetical protein
MTDHEMWERVVRIEQERLLTEPPRLPQVPESPLTVHYTELPENACGRRGSTEWNFYRREVARLLAEGHEGHWVLIKGEEIVGIWDTEEEANRVRIERFLMQDVLMKKICACEPVIRGWGYLRRWR